MTIARNFIPGRRPVADPTSADLARARTVVQRELVPTPLLPAPALGKSAYLKLESLQPTGSFKVRGALAACSALPTGSRIITASAGNHALGTAWAAARLGIPATVVIAETASPAKRDALARLPVELIEYGPDYETAEAHAIELSTDSARKATFVSAYNDPHVIAGQSTVLDEIITQLPAGRPLTIVAAVGGGGLVAGLSMRASELSTPERPIRIVGVEAGESVAVSAAIEAGDTIEIEIGDTIADGLSGNIEPGSITAAIIGTHADRLNVATEGELRAAIRFLIREHGVIAEGAGAAPTAAALAGKIGEVDGDVVYVVSGRNITLSQLVEVLAESEIAS